jgi:hypothetical protein
MKNKPGRFGRNSDWHQCRKTDVVASMDCDCSYDPLELAEHAAADDKECRDGDGVTVSPRRKSQQRTALATGPFSYAVHDVSGAAEAEAVDMDELFSHLSQACRSSICRCKKMAFWAPLKWLRS